MAVEVSSDHGYLALVVVVSFFIHSWMGLKVVSARKLYKVNFPTMYALESENKNARIFNCIQRGHQNFLETVPFFFALLTFGGLQHPKLAAILGVFFLAGRILYFLDYSTGDPKARRRGFAVSLACLMGLIGCCISFAVRQLLG